MPIYELINPSDPYTFEAPSIEVAGYCAAMLSPGFCAHRVGDDVEEQSPILWGWDRWFQERGMLDSAGEIDQWVSQHRLEIAAAFDSFMIGHLAQRQDALDMLAELPEEKREAWRARRQDRHRTSLNQIGERAYQLAKRFRESAKRKAGA